MGDVIARPQRNNPQDRLLPDQGLEGQMGCPISSTGHDEMIPLPLGLADEVGQMIGAFRKLEMKGNPAFQKFLAKKGKNFSSFSAPGMGINDDLYFPLNFFEQPDLPLEMGHFHFSLPPGAGFSVS